MIQALYFSVTILHIILSLYRQKILDIHIVILTILQRCLGKIVFLSNFCILPPPPRQHLVASVRSENGVENFEHLLQRYVGRGGVTVDCTKCKMFKGIAKMNIF